MYYKDDDDKISTDQNFFGQGRDEAASSYYGNNNHRFGGKGVRGNRDSDNESDVGSSFLTKDEAGRDDANRGATAQALLK